MLSSKTTEIGTATVLENGLVEVSIHTGVVLNRDMLLEGYEQISELAQGPYSLLVNRIKTDYSVSFDAIVEGGNHPSVIAQALLIPPYNPHKKLIVETIIDYPRKASTPIRDFVNRETAIDWLRGLRDQSLS